MASPGPMGLMPGRNPISRSGMRRREKSENTGVLPIHGKPVFLDFPVFLVPQLSPLLGFDGLTVFCHRGTKNTDYALISPCYGFVKLENCLLSYHWFL